MASCHMNTQVGSPADVPREEPEAGHLRQQQVPVIRKQHAEPTAEGLAVPMSVAEI